MKRLFIPLLFAIALPTSVNANDADSYYEECIIKAIDKTSRQNDYVNSRELARTCACIANNIVQNLNVRSCPQYGAIPTYEIDRYFE